MTEVFLCETGQLTNASKSALRKAGVVVAEVEDITKASFVRASEVVSPDDMVWAAFDALCHQPKSYGDTGAAQREQLARNLLAVINNRRKGT